MDYKYLSEILSVEGEDYLLDLKISEIIQQISLLKGDVKNGVDDRAINFNPFLKEHETLKSKAQTLLEKISLLYDNISLDIKPKLSSCNSELQNMSSSLNELNLTLNILNQLWDMASTLKIIKIELENKQFYKCSQSVKSLQTIIKESTLLKDIDIFKSLAQESVLIYEQLLYNMSELWSMCVYFSQEMENVKTIVKLHINISLSNEISEIIKATNNLNDNLIEKRFSNKLMNSVINEVIQKRSLVFVENADNEVVLTVEIFQNDYKPQYSIVFENINTIVDFLKTHMNVQIEDGHSFLARLGSNVAKEFTDNLIANCLSETIPSKSEELESYKDVVETAETFQSTLQQNGFLPQNYTSIINYAKNINVLFANKFCQSYLNKARMIMKKDLHNTVPSEEITLNDLKELPESIGKLLREKLNYQGGSISFSKCQISKSAEELLNLINDIMDEMQKSQDLCAVRLFYTVRNIFEMYAAIVPLHHKKFLETLPQQAAIFHNNCMYFTHCLIRLTCTYKSKLPKVLKDHFTILLEEAIVLRRLGTETLETQVSSQRSQIVYILRDSGLATLNEDPKLQPSAEKGVRQCVRQLQILQTVWRDVLPQRVYNNAIGFLLDGLLEELTALSLDVEDVSSETATELVEIFTMVQEKTPTLFVEPKEIHRYARKWQRFKELTLVIGGSLKDINERWSDGMGPLAMEFTPEQVKHLIRALFQNTERRAAMLARIK